MLGRLASRAGLPASVAALVVGILLTGAGPLPDTLRPAPEVVATGTDLALVLLLFVLGLDQTNADHRAAIRSSAGAGALDAAANFLPGLVAGTLAGWDWRAALLLGGVTWASSPAAARTVIDSFRNVGNRETPTALSVLTLEHLGMCAFVPLAAAAAGSGQAGSIVTALVATAAAIAAAAWLAHERGPTLRRAVFGPADDLVLPLAGVALAVAGLAAAAAIPVAAAGLLAGAVLAGPAATATEAARGAVTALRHLSSRAAFLFLGVATGVGAGAVAGGAALAVVTVGTKAASAWWATRRLGPAARLRAGAALAARGEFSVALALVGVSAGLDGDLAAVTAGYVALTSVTAAVAAWRLSGARSGRADRRGSGGR